MSKKKWSGKVDVDSSDNTSFALQRLAVIIALTVFGIGTLASYIFSNSYKSRQDAEYALTISQQVTALSGFIDARVASYRQALRGAAGMVNVVGRENMSSSEWKLFVDTLRSGNKFGELLGIGLVDYIPEEQIEAFQTREGVTIDPSGLPNEYAVIRFIEPSNDANTEVVGFDMYSEPIRRAAMLNARDRGEATMSAAVQDYTIEENDRQKSLIMYYPLFLDGVVSVGAENANASLIGYTYLVFRPMDVFGQQDVIDKSRNPHYEVTDITDQNSIEILYATSNFDHSITETIYKDLKINDRVWRITLHADQSASGIVNHLILFVLGLLSSSAVAFATYTLLNRRSIIISNEHEEQIQNTKDELLALASHQLRTPATGVRQYISMLEKGYFGALTPEQQEITAKANRANERQLEIIDQLLYVAKADAGQLLMNRDVVNMHDLAAGVVEGFSEQISLKNIEMVTDLRLDTFVYGDERFLAMIVENLLSNAIKYSYPDSKITVQLSRAKGKIRLSVADSGVGIEEDQQNQLFKKFSRIDNPLSRLEGGSGLGLYLAQKLAQSHRGKIIVESKYSKGSKFIFEMPVRKPDSNNVVHLTD